MKTTAGDLKAKLEQALLLASALDPRIALAEAGYEALKGLFSATGEVSSTMGQVYAETAETAPDVAQAVSAFVTGQGDALEQSFRDHPGT